MVVVQQKRLWRGQLFHCDDCGVEERLELKGALKLRGGREKTRVKGGLSYEGTRVEGCVRRGRADGKIVSEEDSERGR